MMNFDWIFQFQPQARRKKMNNRLMIKKPMALVLTFMLLLSAVAPIMAMESTFAPEGDVPVALLQQQGPTEPAELESFLDDFFAKNMEEYHIAGAAVAVVKDGGLFFAKGYGYANIEKGIPVDPEQTIFRIGSVGKTFTWTAVMQLAEQGKLDLDADINTYLDFRIPDVYPQPITLKHLLTHTSGIEDRWLESLAADAGELVPEREWLIANFPGRVRPPGEAAGYSNYNAMLAGYIVARVSGEPYDQYIQEHIFDPLGMVHSTVQSQIPADLRRFASMNYTYVDGAFQPFPDYFIQPAVLPSGFHQASVTDMARFMIAHLQNGFYGDPAAEVRILEEATARRMQSTLYTPDPRLRGTAYGFFDLSDNGQWTLGHEGYAPVMSSQLLLLPDQHLGIFIVYNSLGARDGGLTVQHFGFQRAFFDHYYPAPTAAPIQPTADFAKRAGRFVGLYRETNSHSTTPEKAIGLFSALEISAPGDGTLRVPMGGLDVQFVEVDRLYFHQADGPFALVFREDDQGRITHLFTDLMPQSGFERLGWYETPGFNMVLALGSVLVFLSMIPVVVIRVIRNRRTGDNRIAASRGARAAERIILGVCLLNLLFLTGIALWFRPMHPSELHGLSLMVEIVLGLGVLAALLTVGALFYTVLAWKNGYWSVANRAYYSLVTVAAIAFVWFLHYWNWLGWRY
jgi:CubicO group peptidase (beta-lactamase class C family)